MATGKFIAYYRVSTKRQAKSGLGLQAQKKAVDDYLNGGRWTLVGEVTETESGRHSDRPALAKALALCRIHKAKLIVAKMDRLSRNVHFLSGLMEAKVPFVAADMPDANDLTVHILAAVAEAEAEAISTRTKAALAAAKAAGTKLGGDRGNLTRVWRKGNIASARARQKQAATYAKDIMPIIAEIKSAGAGSLRQIAHELNERGILAPRGGEWSGAQVYQVTRRLTAEAYGCESDLDVASEGVLGKSKDRQEQSLLRGQVCCSRKGNRRSRI